MSCLQASAVVLRNAGGELLVFEDLSRDMLTRTLVGRRSMCYIWQAT